MISNLQVVWKRLYKTSSALDGGTLYQLCNLIRRRNVWRMWQKMLLHVRSFLIWLWKLIFYQLQWQHLGWNPLMRSHKMLLTFHLGHVHLTRFNETRSYCLPVTRLYQGILTWTTAMLRNKVRPQTLITIASMHMPVRFYHLACLWWNFKMLSGREMVTEWTHKLFNWGI